MEFQKVEIPQGAFIAFGRKGQVVTVKVASFEPQGGSDANGKVCPQMIGTLTEDAETYRDNGATKIDLKAGDLVTVNAGLFQLKAGLLACSPNPGDVVRMTYTGDERSAKGNAVKQIETLIARGQAPDGANLVA